MEHVEEPQLSQEPDFFGRPPTKKLRIWTAVALFVIALFVRLIGIDWGLPNGRHNQSLHPDELVTASAAVGNPFFKPGFYNYGTLYLTLLKVGSSAGESYGWVPNGEQVAPWKTLRGIQLTGRVISAVSGALSVSILFLLALELTNLLGALIGAFVLLSAPGYVVHSRFQTVDVFGTLLVVLGLWLLVRLNKKQEGGTIREVALAGLVIGLAAGTKYAGAVLLIPAIWVVWMVCKKSLAQSAAVLFGGCIAGFLVATPGVFLEAAAFKRDFMYEMAHSAAGHGLVFVNTPNGFLYHSLINLPAAVGVSATFLGAIGLTWAFISKRAIWVIPALFFVAYLLFIGRAEVKFMRYVFPLLPCLCLGVAFMISRLHEMGGKARWVGALVAMLLVFSITSPTGTANVTQFMASEDARDTSAKWIEDNLPQNATIGFVNDPWFYSPTLFPDTDLLIADQRVEAMRMHNARLLRFQPEGEPRKEWDSRLVTDLKPDFIVFSSFEFYDHDRLSEPEFVKTIELICSQYRLKAQFFGERAQVADKIDKEKAVTRLDLRELCRQAIPEPHDMMYIRPVIWVFQRLDSK